VSTYIVYHKGCADGFGGAWAAWKQLGDAAEYVPAQYGEPEPEIPDGATVYLIDFSLKRDATLALKQRCPNLTILDHHKTAQAELEGLDFATFDMDKSGAMLAWEHFHPGLPPPALIRYIEDRDLWRWALPDSREISAALWSYPMDFQTWNRLSVLRLANEGAAILRYMQQQTAMICNQAREAEVGGIKMPVVNATSLWSEVGEELLRRYPHLPCAASYFETKHGKRMWSLRSRGDFDVSELARSKGGGGHRAAAGFSEPLQ
jgi:uncharacterized protein